MFDPISRRRRGERRLSMEAVSRSITAIGIAAKVKVSEANRRGKRTVKWASAHDLRRSFGVRWSARVMPAILQQLMRHESIDTTLQYIRRPERRNDGRRHLECGGTGRRGHFGGHRRSYGERSRRNRLNTKWGRRDSNSQPTDYESAALTD